jgi:hypothetical protein
MASRLSENRTLSPRFEKLLRSIGLVMHRTLRNVQSRLALST